ncbi:glycine zipper 2TM domain-containing protein [Cupriavidus basilensis]
MKGARFGGVAASAAVIGVAGCGRRRARTAPAAAGWVPDAAPAPGTNTRQAPAGRCFMAGSRSIEPVTTQENSSGVLGTVIGGVAGGLLGHQVGEGTGNTIATIGGAVAGGLAGNQIEKRAPAAAPRTVYRVNVRLDDDGRLATVTQRDVSSLRIGSRAQVANDMAMPY